MGKTGEMAKCQNCGKEVYITKYRKKTFRFCSRRCHGKAVLSAKIIQDKIKRRSGKDHPNYKGGHIRKDGYKLICVNGKLEYEHRIVVENFIGRKLVDDENIHHLNHNKSDNRIENLKLYKTRAEHTKNEGHIPNRRYNPTDSKECIGCKNIFYRGNSYNFNEKKFCSHKCYMLNSKRNQYGLLLTA